MAVMEPSTSLRFAAAARALGLAGRAQGLRVPSFRSPPRLDGATRTMRRRRDGHASIAVVLRDRPWSAVLADMIDGVIAANDLAGLAADQARVTLWHAVTQSEDRAA
jgi:hypothetical protein